MPATQVDALGLSQVGNSFGTGSPFIVQMFLGRCAYAQGNKIHRSDRKTAGDRVGMPVFTVDGIRVVVKNKTGEIMTITHSGGGGGA